MIGSPIITLKGMEFAGVEESRKHGFARIRGIFMLFVSDSWLLGREIRGQAQRLNGGAFPSPVPSQSSQRTPRPRPGRLLAPRPF